MAILSTICSSHLDKANKYYLRNLIYRGVEEKEDTNELTKKGANCGQMCFRESINCEFADT